jgi:small subunit ribosomal protein S6
MSQYETVCVIKPDIQGDRLDKINDKVKKVLSDFKVTDVNQQDWGIRKLAYPIAKHKTAHYFCFHYEGGGGLVAELERQFSYDDAILRYLTIKVGKHDHKELKPDPFQFGKIEAESYSHPFGGGYDRRDRYDRRGGGFDRRDNRDSRDHQAEPKKEEN